MERVVFHLDMDAFYASVEVRDRPELAGQAVVIGADPRGGRGRGVVCTASYPARAYGIRSAMPIATAYRLAPHAIYLPPNFPKYTQASRAVMAVAANYTPRLDVVGLDEAYLDMSAVCQDAQGAIDWERAHGLARSLQAAVRRHTGLSCSIGVAGNKAFAKIASDLQKPHGITVLNPTDAPRVLAPLSASKIHGCGPKTAKRLEELDIRTISDLAAANSDWLTRHLGSYGAELIRTAQGQDQRPVEGHRGMRKSRGNESTFAEDMANHEAVMATAHEQLTELLDDQARAGPWFTTLSVKLRYHDFRTLTRAHTFATALDPSHAGSRRMTAAMLDHLLDGRLGTPIRLVGVRLTGFVEPTGQRFLEADAQRAAPRRRPTRPCSAHLRWTRLPLSQAP